MINEKRKTNWYGLNKILGRCAQIFQKNKNLEAVVAKANTGVTPEPSNEEYQLSEKLAENVTATQTDSKKYDGATNETQPQDCPVHVLTRPPEAMDLSFYMLNIANQLKVRPRSVDLKISLPQEPFIPETYRGRDVRIVGVVVQGKYIPKEGLIPDMPYYLSTGTSILGGEDITPEYGGQKFYDFLFNSLGQSFANGNLPPELPGRLVSMPIPTIKPREEKQ